jgi:addiction module HigA family antidote
MPTATKITPIHPGEILLEEFMKPLRLNANRLALKLRVPAQLVSEIINGQRGITPATAIRLNRLFGTSAEFWMNLQSNYELRTWRERIGPEVDRDVTPLTDRTPLRQRKRA